MWWLLRPVYFCLWTWTACGYSHHWWAQGSVCQGSMSHNQILARSKQKSHSLNFRWIPILSESKMLRSCPHLFMTLAIRVFTSVTWSARALNCVPKVFKIEYIVEWFALTQDFWSIFPLLVCDICLPVPPDPSPYLWSTGFSLICVFWLYVFWPSLQGRPQVSHRWGHSASIIPTFFRSL